MRILYSHRIQSRDGQSVHLEALVDALRRAGHEVIIVGPGIYAAGEFGGEPALVALFRRWLPNGAGEMAEIVYNFPAALRLWRACRRFRPDIIYERYNLFFVAGALLARLRSVPFYVEVNAPLADERARNGGVRLLASARMMERFVWRSATRIVAVTGVLRDLIAEQGAPRERIAVVPNGIDIDRFSPGSLASEHRDIVTVGFVGFMRAWHGLDALLDAAAMRSNARVRLLIAGDGPAQADLRARAERLGLAERVRFTGLAAPDAVPGLLSEMDIAVQPKVVAYASPLKIFEYMAAGRAIVAPDQANIREILRHEETALLFDPGGEDALWQAIRRLIEDPQLRFRLSAAARSEITRRDFTWHANAVRLLEWASADLAPSRNAARKSGPGAPAIVSLPKRGL